MLYETSQIQSPWNVIPLKYCNYTFKSPNRLQPGSPPNWSLGRVSGWLVRTCAHTCTIPLAWALHLQPDLHECHHEHRGHLRPHSCVDWCEHRGRLWPHLCESSRAFAAPLAWALWAFMAPTCVSVIMSIAGICSPMCERSRYFEHRRCSQPYSHERSRPHSHEQQVCAHAHMRLLPHKTIPSFSPSTCSRLPTPKDWGTLGYID